MDAYRCGGVRVGLRVRWKSGASFDCKVAMKRRGHVLVDTLSGRFGSIYDLRACSLSVVEALQELSAFLGGGIWLIWRGGDREGAISGYKARLSGENDLLLAWIGALANFGRLEDFQHLFHAVRGARSFRSGANCFIDY